MITRSEFRKKIVKTVLEKKEGSTEEEANKIADHLLSLKVINERTYETFLKSAGII